MLLQGKETIILTEENDIAGLIRQLFEQRYMQLHNFARRFVESDDEADDVVADVFLELWQNRDHLDFSRNIISYLYRATSARALNVLRHKGISPVRIDLLESINATRMEYLALYEENSPVEQREMHDQIENAINSLPDKCREVFRLSYIHGLRNQDIADTMNVSVRTVEAHMYKALRLLREKLKHLLVLAIFFQFF